MPNDHLQKILDQFSNWIERSRYSKTSGINYVSVIKNMVSYMKSFNVHHLNDASLDLILKFVCFRGNKKYAANFIEYRKSVLYLFYKWAYSKGYCRNNPIIEHRKLKLNRKASLHDKNNTIFSSKEMLSPEEQEKLISFKVDNEDPLAVRNKCIVLLILASALYAEEATALLKTSLNLSVGYLSITDKTNENKKRGKKEKKEKKENAEKSKEFGRINTRIVQLDLKLCKQSCLNWLAIRDNMLKKNNCPELFFTRRFTPITKRMLYKIVSEFLQAAGITKTHLGAELLRQTAICNMVRRGLSLEEIQANIGFSNLRSIDKYRQACLS